MNIRVVWDDDAKTMLRYIFERSWTWEDFYAAKEYAYQEVEQVQHPVGVIMDAPGNMIIPANLLTHFRSALHNKHPNTVVVVVLIRTPFVRSMMNLLIKLSGLAGTTLRMCNTLEEARQIVQARLRAP